MNHLSKKILIVEDEQSLLKVLELLFRSNNFTVLKAVNTLEAKTFLQENPDVILLDILLPGESGLNFLTEVKNKDQYKNIPVIILSNYSDTETKKQAKEKGADLYLVKVDNSPLQILEQVNKMLANIKAF